MIKVKASTKHGQQLLSRANNSEGYLLTDVYSSYSPAKKSAWDFCFEQFLGTASHNNFRICSHNTFQFSVAWEGILDGKRITRLETALNSYYILLDY